MMSMASEHSRVMHNLKNRHEFDMGNCAAKQMQG